MMKKERKSYLQVKVNGKQIGKHRYLYEQAYGEIPKGYCVCFLDGDNRNFDIDNLYAIPLRAIGTTNRVGCFKRNENETAEDFKKKLEKAEAKSKEVDEYIKKKGGSLECSARKRNELWRRKNRENPEYRAKIKEHVRAYHAKRRATDPEYCEKIKEYFRAWYAKRRQDPEFLKKRKECNRVHRAEKMKDPEYRENYNKCKRVYRAERRATDPEYCEKIKEYGRAYYAKKKALKEAKV